jgi:hypothetical protein
MPITEEVMYRAWLGADGMVRAAVAADDPGALSRNQDHGLVDDP